MRYAHSTKRLCFFTAAVMAVTVIAFPTSAGAASDLSLDTEANVPTTWTQSVQVRLSSDGGEGERVSAQALCQAEIYGDNPHISTSSSTAPRAVQAHATWQRGTCSANQADVTTQLDRKNPIGLFQAVGTQGRKVLNSQDDFKLPSGNRTVARYECNEYAMAPFRSWTEIDMIGVSDIQNRVYSPETGDIDCG